MDTIKVAQILGNRLPLRRVFAEAMQSVKDHSVLDFSGVEFISRSCADELYTLKDSRNLSIVNMSEQVRRVFEAVKYGRNNPKAFKVADINIHTFVSYDEMLNYFGGF